MSNYKKYLAVINESIYLNLDSIFSMMIYESAEYEEEFKIGGKTIKNIFTPEEALNIRNHIEKDLIEFSMPVSKAPLLAKWLTREASKRGESYKYRYIHNNKIVEDALMLIDNLIVFLRYNKSMPVRDITQINSSELNDMVQKFREKIDEAEAVRAIKSGEAKKFDVGKFTIIEVRSHAAIQIYGAGTRWCITMDEEDGGLTHWNRYTNNGKEPAYVIIPKSNPDNKYCFIFGAEEFRNSGDDMVNPVVIADDDSAFIEWLESKINIKKFKNYDINFEKIGDKYYLRISDYTDLEGLYSRDHKDFVNSILDSNLEYFPEISDEEAINMFKMYADENNTESVKKYMKENAIDDYDEDDNIISAFHISASNAIESSVQSYAYRKIIETINDFLVENLDAKMIDGVKNNAIGENGIEISKIAFIREYFRNDDADDDLVIEFDDDFNGEDPIDSDYYNSTLTDQLYDYDIVKK